MVTGLASWGFILPRSGMVTDSYTEKRGNVSMYVCAHTCVHVCGKAATLQEGLTYNQAVRAQGPMAGPGMGWAWKVERAWLASAALSKTGVQMLAQLA